MVSEHAPWWNTASTRALVALLEVADELGLVDVVGDLAAGEVAELVGVLRGCRPR